MRNLASLGGSLLWNHPGSDLIPLLLAAGAFVITENTQAEESSQKLEALIKKGLKRGELLVKVVLPLPTDEEPFIVKFYKHARRSTSDLAIANMGVGYKLQDNGNRLQVADIFIGGIGIAIQNCKQSGVIKAKMLETLLTAQTNLRDLTVDAICSAVEKDLTSTLEGEVSSLDKTAFRISLVIGFILKLIDFILGDGESPDEFPAPLKFHQLHEKTPEDQAGRIFCSGIGRSKIILLSKKQLKIIKNLLFFRIFQQNIHLWKRTPWTRSAGLCRT